MSAPLPKSAYVRELERFRAEVGQRAPAAQPRHDHVADALIRCSSLGFVRGSDGHQNCVLRAMDRIDHAAQRYMRRDDEISVTVPVPRIVEQHPVYPVPPVGAVPRSSSALVDCRVDPTPPCYVDNVEQQSPWPLHTPGSAR